MQTARDCLHVKHPTSGHAGSGSQHQQDGVPDWANRPSARQLWLDIASAAESGWDFSSRWLGDGFNLHTMRTTQVVN
eukprot:1159784-Pelagomonas_calceolata.AAC.8